MNFPSILEVFETRQIRILGQFSLNFNKFKQDLFALMQSLLKICNGFRGLTFLFINYLYFIIISNFYCIYRRL